jgi:hypothetical protein
LRAESREPRAGKGCMRVESRESSAERPARVPQAGGRAPSAERGEATCPPLRGSRRGAEKGMP